MFEAHLSKAVIFRKVIESMLNLVQEVNILADSKGISIDAMDSSHVSLVFLHLNEGGFESFRCDKSFNLGINLGDLSKILKMSGAEDSITLKASEELSYLTILLENKEQSREVEFQLNLLNIETDSLSVPETNYGCVIDMSSLELQRIFKDLGSVSEVVNIDVKSNYATFLFTGKSGNGKIKLGSNEAGEQSLYIKCEEEYNGSYGIQYLNNFLKASSLSNRVQVNLSKDYPLLIEFDIENMGSLKFYLAPKMDDE